MQNDKLNVERFWLSCTIFYYMRVFSGNDQMKNRYDKF